MKLVGVIFLMLFGLFVKANENELSKNQLTVLIQLDEKLSLNATIYDEIYAPEPVKFKRGKAILFTLLTGLFGGHRIYLGTHHRTPIIYSITLGGLGILPFVDLINIIFTKDLSKFEHKTQIIMWGN